MRPSSRDHRRFAASIARRLQVTNGVGSDQLEGLLARSKRPRVDQLLASVVD